MTPQVPSGASARIGTHIKPQTQSTWSVRFLMLRVYVKQHGLVCDAGAPDRDSITEITQQCVTRNADGTFDVCVSDDIIRHCVQSLDEHYEVDIVNIQGPGTRHTVSKEALPIQYSSVATCVPDVRIFLCQKDETELLGPWLEWSLSLVYHPSHVRVMDDASTDEAVLQILREAANKGVDVVYRGDPDTTPPFFPHKNVLFGQYVRSCVHDLNTFFFALDADDFLVCSHDLRMAKWKTLHSTTSNMSTALHIKKALVPDARQVRERLSTLAKSTPSHGAWKYERLRNISFAPGFFARADEPPKIAIYGGGDRCLRADDDVYCVGYHFIRNTCVMHGDVIGIMGVEFHNAPHALRIAKSLAMARAPGVTDHRFDKYDTQSKLTEREYEAVQCRTFDCRTSAYSEECSRLVGFAKTPRVLTQDETCASALDTSEMFVQQPRVVLLCQWYMCDHENAQRQIELDYCAVANTNNEDIHDIVWFISRADVQEVASKTNATFDEVMSKWTQALQRGSVVFTDQRVTYGDVFNHCNEMPQDEGCATQQDTVYVLINTDIIVDKQNLKRLLRIMYDPLLCTPGLDTVLCLSRWNSKMHNLQTFELDDKHRSQDAWVWKGNKVTQRVMQHRGHEISQIHMQKPGCDNRIAHELSLHAFVSNPSRSVVVKHIHKVSHRTYARGPDERVMTPYLFVPPCHAVGVL